jgi:hypothetical protein
MNGKKLLVSALLSIATLPALAGVALADANPNNASCVGIASSTRAPDSQPDGVRALKSVAASFGINYGQLNQGFAHNHGGTIQSCIPL